MIARNTPTPGRKATGAFFVMPLTLTRLGVAAASLTRLGVAAASLLLLGTLAGCKDNNATNATGGGSTNGTSGNSTVATSGGDTIVLGEYASITGSEADFGKQSDDGVQLAVDEINAAGGVDVNGKKMKVRVEVDDDGSDAGKAETSVKRLIDEKNVIGIIGEVASSSSLAGGGVCQAKGVPMISPSSTNITVTQKGDYIFRVCFLDSYQAAVVARFAHDQLHAKTAACFTNKTAAYSVGFTDEFKKAFTRYGGQIVAEASYAKTDKDFNGPLQTIKASNPDVILVPGYYNDAGQVAKQARGIGITVPLLGGDGWDSSEILKIGGDGVNNTYFSNHMSVTDPNPKVVNFVKAYTDKFKKTPGALSALGYDATKIMCDAITRAKSVDKKAIRDAIAQTKDYDAVSGKITIDADRNAKKSAVMIAIKDGKFDYAATIPDPEQPMTAATGTQGASGAK